MAELIKSAQNRFIRLYRSLDRRKAREKTGLLALEGERLVHEALLNGYRPLVILLEERYGQSDFVFLRKLPPTVPVLRVEEKLFARTARTESPQGILAIVPRPVYMLADLFAAENTLLLVVDRLQDPGNLGTMLRSAAAAGAGGAVLLPGTVDAGNPKALRATMGAVFRLPLAEVPFAALHRELRKRGVLLVVAQGGAGVDYALFDWRRPVAVVIGNEGAGVSAEILKKADAKVNVPMTAGVESLNAAVAMSIIFFEAFRQRRQQNF